MSSHFTPAQQSAIEFFPTDPVKKNLVIEAGAGSGKTTILKERVKFLLTQKQFLPQDLIVITFTKNATSELRHRIEKIGVSTNLENKTKFIQISTMDSFFISVVESLYPVWWDLNRSYTQQIPPQLSLLNEAQALIQIETNLTKSFETFSDIELRNIADFILAGGFEKSEGFKAQSSPFHTLLSTMLNDGFLSTSIDDIRISAQHIHPATQKLIQKCHLIARQSYEERLAHGTLTHQDYNVFLKENLSQSCPLYFKELIVDEYQDTNHIQHQILWKLVQLNQAQMTVVGDPKQSIYAFRGSHVDVFHSLLKSPEWNVISLDINFRSTEHLLNELNTLSHLSFDWQPPKIPELFKNSFFFKEAQKKAIAHKPLKAGITASEEICDPKVVLFEYESPKNEPSAESKKRDFNEKNIKALACYLKQKVKNNAFEWKNLAVLCEKNSQIQKIKKIFLEFGIPCTVDSQKSSAQQTQFDQYISLVLLKVLNSASLDFNFDMVSLLSSPLVSYSLAQVLQNSFTHDSNPDSNIQKILAVISEHQEKFKYHPFIAWQTCRWALANQSAEITKSKSSVLFCLSMDNFAKNLYETLKSGYTDNLFEILSKSLEQPKQIKIDDENAVAIKTVHGSKGLEWDVVCFYPANSSAEKRESFSVSSSWPYLDINWLSEDVKSLSYLSKINNEKFNEIDQCYDEKKDKIIWFSDLRNSYEKNFERQRIFYTAFTRPRKSLLFVHPERHGANSARQIDKKFDFSNYDNNFEQDVYLKYAYLTQENKNNAIHVKFSDIQNDTEISKNDDAHELGYTLEPIQILSQKEAAQAFESNIVSSPLSSITKIQKLRKAAYKGIIYHACAENNIFEGQSFMENLTQNSIKYWNEFEILNQNSENNTIQKNVIDLLLVFKASNFIQIYKELTKVSAYSEWNIENNSEYVFLILDFKTGLINQSGIDQVNKYVTYIQKLSQEKWFKILNGDTSPQIVTSLFHVSNNLIRFPQST